MKKRVLALVMSTAMIASVLTACGGNDTPAADTNTSNNDAPAADTSNNDAPAADTANNDAPAADAAGSDADVDYGTGSITIWVAENVQTFTQEQVAAFLEANPQYAGYTVTVEPVGEGDAATNMITDVEGGADIYAFAQDQLARLVSSGAVAPVAADYASWIAEQNIAGAASAAVVGGTTYAFPITADNGFFMYYDKSVVTDPTSLDAVVADCEAAGKSVYVEINSGWYQPAFFFGTGCTLTYDADDIGNFTACNIDYASDKGVAAFKAIINLSKSSAFVNGSAASNATNLGAIIDGTWDAGAIKDLLGDNYACAKLPEFTVDGTNYQLGAFGGYKLMGVKPQTDANKYQVCLAIAQFLSNEETQLARYEAVGWGPSNIAAQANEAVQADEALTALGEQLGLDVSISQGQYPDDYWTLATSLGDDIIAGKFDNASDEELMAQLETFQATCQSYAQ